VDVSVDVYVALFHLKLPRLPRLSAWHGSVEMKPLFSGKQGYGDLVGILRDRVTEETKFCAVKTLSKAAPALGMGDSTLRDLLREWARRGEAYARMLDVVKWRKRVGGKERVPLNENIILGRAASPEYPALLSEVLDGLLSMTGSNWEELSSELAEMLRAEIA